MANHKLLKDKVEVTEQHVKLHRWGGQSFVKVKSPLPDALIVEERDAHDRKAGKVSKFKQADQDREIHVYEIDPFYAEWDSDGDLEYEIVLKKRPDSNRIVLDIEDSGDLDFFFQPEQPPKPGIQTDPYVEDPVTGERVNPVTGLPWDPTELDYGEQRGSDLWPEVLNSYCVYHKWKSGGEYRAGKFGQIFRPKAHDRDGEWVWCDFDRDADPSLGQLVIVVPQDFLDGARYPVTIDPTFGYETNATAASTSIESNIVGSEFASNLTGQVHTISVYSNPSSTTRTFSAAVYNSDNTLVVGETSNTPAATGLAWRDVDIRPRAFVDNGTNYILVSWGLASSGTHVTWYDAGSSNQGHVDADIGPYTWPNPLVPTHSTNKYSIHAHGTTPLYGFMTSAPGSRLGSADGVTGANQTRVQKHKAPRSETLKEIGAWIKSTDGTEKNFRLAIFTHDATNNCPETMVANSESATLAVSSASYVKVTHTYAGTKPTVTAGTIYWLGLFVEDDNVAIDANDTATEKGEEITYGTATFPTWLDGAGWHTGQSPNFTDFGIYTAPEASSESASASPSQSPSASPSRSPSASPSASPSPSPSVSPSPSPSASPSASPSPSPSVSPSPSPSASPSESPSASPSASESPSRSPSRSPSESPSESPSKSPSASPSPSPSESPSLSPSASESPSRSPSTSPSASPSVSPSPSPSVSPSESPSASPSLSESPSASPSRSPSESPSESPSGSPSLSPSASESPSRSPSESPSLSPSASASPSISPSQSPSASPSRSPSRSPSASPSPSPSRSPSESPSPSPSVSPSQSPSVSPSPSPSVPPERGQFRDTPSTVWKRRPDVVWDKAESPSASPSISPSASPSESPSPSPSESPSASPSASESPSVSPSLSPSASPSESPSLSPSASESPSVSPSPSPSASPSPSPSGSPSESPSESPSGSPSISPSESPSLSPSVSESPSASPSGSPSESPSASPSEGVSESPSGSPSESPSASPSVSPSPSLSGSPSPSPSASPSVSPSVSPSPSPGYAYYTKGNYATLPSDDADLETVYTAGDYTDVASVNQIRVGQAAVGEYAIHQYKEFATANECAIAWVGQSDQAPSTSAVVMEIYKHSTNAWEQIASNNTAAANTDFELVAGIADLTNYKDGSSVVSVRVYQLHTYLLRDEFTGTTLGANLPTNPDMELDSNWSATGSPETSQRSSTRAHGGTYSWYVNDSTPSNGGIQSDVFSTTIDKWYRVSAWIWCVSGVARVVLTRGDGSNPTATYRTTTTTGSWELVQFWMTQILGGASTRLKILNDSGAVAAEFYVDDVAVQDASDCEPGPGTRFCADTGKGWFYYLDSGNLVKPSSSANMMGFNDSITRVAGRLAVQELNLSALDQAVGFSTTRSSFPPPAQSQLQFSGSGLYSVIDGIATFVGGVPSTGVPYRVTQVLKTAGAYQFLKGGSYVNNTLLRYVGSGSVSPVYYVTGISNVTIESTSSHARVPNALWLPTPIAYDDFSGTWPTSKATGPDGQPCTARTWSTGNGTWAIASQALVNTPVTFGSDTVVNGNMESGDPPSNWGVTNGTLDGVADERTGGVGIQSLEVTATSAPARATQTQSSGSTNKWHEIDGWIKRQSGTSYGYIQAQGGVFPSYGQAITSSSWTRVKTWAVFTNPAVAYLWLTVYTSGDVFRFDDVSCKALDTDELICSVSDSATADAVVSVKATRGSYEGPIGLMVNLDSPSNPQNGRLIFHAGGALFLYDFISGSYTLKTNGPVTFSAGAPIIVVTDGTTLRMYYNNVLISTQQTMVANTNTKHGVFSPDPGASFDDFTVFPRGTGGEYAALDAF